MRQPRRAREPPLMPRDLVTAMLQFGAALRAAGLPSP